ncbi:response regulator [Microcoleus sp. FACHB-SPT15]|uniref:response regulator n=1 Tax=Microcoleus sp. FACHB-SPT15 TaxID=2692830 RepID=UPI0017806DE7|nr:response regulator [Microcoleus sp. FACHB-SPT15]MBD1803917.1 response regulator [Microcoleus sp. FACHB-SPT15]
MNKILAIDDDELFLELLLELLRKKGWQAICADSGRLGLQLAKEQIPNLIICDIRMPDINGYEVLNRLRQDPATKKIPLILFTATLTDKERIRASDTGADDCLDKFCSFDELFKAINTHIPQSSLAMSFI